MSERGTYAKGEAKKQEILDLALRLVGEKGYSSTTLREIGEAAGLSKNGLLHHFGSKEDLFAAVLHRWDEMERSRYAGPSDAFESILDHISRFTETPGLMHLYARLSAEAIEPGHPAHEYFTRRLQDVRADFEQLFEELQGEGQLREGLDPRACAALLIAVLEGLQTQWLYDSRVDIAEHTRRFFTSVSTDAGLSSALAGVERSVGSL